MSVNGRLIPELVAINPALVIFDKDGTLIDIKAMWGTWLRQLAQELEIAAGLPITTALFAVMAFEPGSGRIDPAGPLAIAPVPKLRQLTLNVLVEAGLFAADAEQALATAWQPPDPVTLAHPLTDLNRLFTTLRAGGLKIGIATSDDRAPTQATLAGLGLSDMVDALACADDVRSIKPAPDMVWTICRALDITPARAVMVGDNPDDLRMGRVAGVGLVVGVLSGVSPVALLAPYADIVLPSVAGLIRPNQA